MDEVGTVDGGKETVGVGRGTYHHIGVAGLVADGHTTIELRHRAAGAGIGGRYGIVGEVLGSAEIEVHREL